MTITPGAAVGALLRGLIRLYQLLVSPLLPPSCRFHPSCSAYAAEAIGTHGAWHGTLLASRRLLRCHPWGGGGYDPVPPLDLARDLALDLAPAAPSRAHCLDCR